MSADKEGFLVAAIRCAALVAMGPLCGIDDLFSTCDLLQQDIWAQYMSSLWREVALL